MEENAQTGPGEGRRENMAQPRPVRRTARKRVGVPPEGMSPLGLTRQCSINEARGNGGKVVHPNRGDCSTSGMIQGNDLVAWIIPKDV